jgi:hypothetical protein
MIQSLFTLSNITLLLGLFVVPGLPVAATDPVMRSMFTIKLSIPDLNKNINDKGIPTCNTVFFSM